MNESRKFQKEWMEKFYIEYLGNFEGRKVVIIVLIFFVWKYEGY